MVVSLAWVSAAEAGNISIFAAPDKSYQNTTNNPCIFYGPGSCHDPGGWPPPVGNTGSGGSNGAFSTNPLTQTYENSTYTAWVNTIGPTFVIGYDINQDKNAQTLSEFTIRFFDSSNLEIANYVFSPALQVPDHQNGNGFADYVLAAGCAGTVSGTGTDAQCSQYSPFVVPNGTVKIVMTFGMTDYNDGADQIFAAPFRNGRCVDCNDGSAPEPATLILLGTGLAAAAYRLRRRGPRT